MTNPFAFKSERRSGGEKPHDQGQELTDFSSYSSLRRYGNLEDISQIGGAVGGGGSRGVRFEAEEDKTKKTYEEDEEALIYQVQTSLKIIYSTKDRTHITYLAFYSCFG